MMFRIVNLTGTLLISIAALSSLFAQSATFNDAVDTFYSKYVIDGQVDYKSIKTSPAELEKLVSAISNASINLDAPTGDVDKAFLVNAYNILTIKGIINAYPTDSPLSIKGFFDRQKYDVSGKQLTLDELEKGILFKKFPDARLHFVLVCAAKSCPILLDKAFRAEILDQQLQKATINVINDLFFVKPDFTTNTLQLSEIFKWYEKDFEAEEGSIIGYINQYITKALPLNMKIKYFTYDWKLNDYSIRKINNNSNLNTFSPTSLLRENEFEVKQFFNLYTQTAFFNGDFEKQEDSRRSTFFTFIQSVFWGYSQQLNLGFDAYVKSVRYAPTTDNPFDVFQFKNTTAARNEFSHIAPKVKYALTSSDVIQVSALLPLGSNFDGTDTTKAQPFIDVNGTQFNIQYLKDYAFNNQWQLYGEAGILYRSGSVFEDFITPVKLIMNYYANQSYGFYALTTVAPAWSGTSLSGFYNEIGLGGKLYLSSALEVELLATQFVFGKNQGAGVTYNLGWRYRF